MPRDCPQVIWWANAGPQVAQPRNINTIVELLRHQSRGLGVVEIVILDKVMTRLSVAR